MVDASTSTPDWAKDFVEGGISPAPGRVTPHYQHRATLVILDVRIIPGIELRSGRDSGLALLAISLSRIAASFAGGRTR